MKRAFIGALAFTQILLVSQRPSLADSALITTYDADFYYAYGRSVQNGRSELFIGNENNPNVGQDFNFASLKWSSANLSQSFGLLSPSEKIFLRLNILPFEVYTGLPNFGPPPSEFLSSGVSFQFRIVKLLADFSSLSQSNRSAYYTQNFAGSQTVGANYSISGVGSQLFDVTSLVQDWISSPSTNFGLGLVGVADRSPYINPSNNASFGVTMIFSASENGTGSLSPALIPEPTAGELFLGAILVWLAVFHHRKRPPFFADS